MIRRIVGAAGVFAAVLATGIAGYLWLGDGRWTAGDALYMTVITLSTVGYGETLEGLNTVPGARAFTMLLILAGSGGMLYLTSSVTAFIVEGDLRGALLRRRMDNAIRALDAHVIVAGCGATGSSVISELTKHGHGVVVLESNEAKIDRLRREHGLTPPYILGDATAEAVLEEAGIARASGLVAALSDDRDDLFLVFTARHMNPRLKIVAKTVDPANARKMEMAGADFVVSPASLGGLRLAAALHRASVLRFLDAMSTDAVDPHHIDEVELPADSPVVGRKLGDTRIRACSALVLAIRTPDGAYTYNPPTDTVLEAGHTLILLLRTEVHDDLLELLGVR
ncbi:MAG: potassium channel protein [Myxococcales bacterium]|nr:potassium channel protein [Myxococcales bacterium]MCB9692392.1 potassium channel protein [Alphaproteobacteria bacterium]